MAEVQNKDLPKNQNNSSLEELLKKSLEDSVISKSEAKILLEKIDAEKEQQLNYSREQEKKLIEQLQLSWIEWVLNNESFKKLLEKIASKQSDKEKMEQFDWDQMPISIDKNYPLKSEKELKNFTWLATQRDIDENGVFYIYRWEFKNWKKEWKWLAVFSNWDKYNWDFKNDNKEWKWVYVWSDTSRYEWDFKNDKREWKWVMYWVNWDKYDWEWKDWKMNWKWLYQAFNWSKFDWEWANGERKEWKWTFQTWKWFSFERTWSNWEIERKKVVFNPPLNTKK